MFSERNAVTNKEKLSLFSFFLHRRIQADITLMGRDVGFRRQKHHSSELLWMQSGGTISNKDIKEGLIVAYFRRML
jgi:hypothetical protein